MKLRNAKGSITVEAAIVLPLFISAFITVAFLIKLVYVHEMVQHAISETANELAVYGYVYHISGMQEIEEKEEGKSQLFGGHLSTVFEAFSNIRNLSEQVDKNIKGSGNPSESDNQGDRIEAVKNTVKLAGEAGEELDKVLDIIGSVRDNPREELDSIASMLVSDAFDSIKAQVCLPIVRHYMKRYINTDDVGDINKKLSGMNIVNGLEGLDFGDSRFFEDEDCIVDIIVKYKIDIPVPIKVIPSLQMVQRATCKAWTGGIDYPVLLSEDGEEYDVWSLGNFQRGLLLRAKFGANLPNSFPVLSSYKAGKAVIIKSLDTTAQTYQNTNTLKKMIREYVDKLDKYAGQEEPWGSKKIVIKQSEIKEKQLLLVIPGNPLNSIIEGELDKCVQEAAVKGIKISIEKYGIKKN